MNKRFYPVAALTLLAVAVAIGGYLAPAPSQAVPVRVLLNNSAGAVVFNHQYHVEKAALSCESCHHESQTPREDVVSCFTCHGVTFDEAFRTGHAAAIQDEQACVTCHHMEFGEKALWNHDEHIQLANDDCTACHHTPDIEPEPQNCANCHGGINAGGKEKVPPLKESVHTRCQTCHEDYFTEGLKGCMNCHAEQPSRQVLEGAGSFTVNSAWAFCSTCHTEKPEDLIPGTMDAFHKKCMGCHERDAEHKNLEGKVTEGKGPYTKEQCNQCHQK